MAWPAEGVVGDVLDALLSFADEVIGAAYLLIGHPAGG
jgi:hypothetical protein